MMKELYFIYLVVGIAVGIITMVEKIRTYLGKKKDSSGLAANDESEGESCDSWVNQGVLTQAPFFYSYSNIYYD